MVRSVGWLRPRQLPGVAAGAVAAFVFVGCATRRDVEIIDASLTSERTLLIGIGACNADENRAKVLEEPKAVTISVTTDDPAGGDDCADGLTVRLAEPLGDRRLIDGSTGESVNVRAIP